MATYTIDKFEYSGNVYVLQDSGALQLTGGSVTGPVTFGDTITVDDATLGTIVVNGNASFTNNIQANTINGVAVGNSPKFTDTNTEVSTLTLASGSTAGTALTYGGKFTLTAGSKTVSFTMPASDNTNTTYTLSNALSSHKFTETLTAGGSGSGTSTGTMEFAAGTGITLTDDTTNKKITIACSVTNTDTKVNMIQRGTTKSYLLGTTTAPTSSTQAVTSVAETGVYFDTTAATLVATTFKGALTGTASGNLTSSSTLDATKLSGTIPSSCYTDTKNTAGSTASSSKLFLIGATSQAANPQTYSRSTAYIETDGCLYSNGKKTLVEEYTSGSNYLQLSPSISGTESGFSINAEVSGNGAFGLGVYNSGISFSNLAAEMTWIRIDNDVNTPVHINGVVTPTYDTDAVNKKYVDDKHATKTATLSTTWSSNQQTVTVSGVTTSNTVIVTPAPASYDAYCAAGIYCSAQAANSLTFKCEEAPSSSLTVNILIVN